MFKNYFLAVLISAISSLFAEENSKYDFKNFIGEYIIATIESQRVYKVDNPATILVAANIENLSKESNHNLALFLWLTATQARELNDIIPLITHKIKKKKILEILQIIDADYIGNKTFTANHAVKTVKKTSDYFRDLKSMVMSPDWKDW
jgi:hypothetical protein